jgi:hypothetical protein
VNLRKRELGMLAMDRFGAPFPSDSVDHYFEDFDVRVIDPGNASVVQDNVAGDDGGRRLSLRDGRTKAFKNQVLQRG